MKTLLAALFLVLATCHAAPPSTKLFEVDIDPSIFQDETKLLRYALQTVINRLTPGVNDLENPVILAAEPKQLIQSKMPKTHNNSTNITIRFKPEAIQQLMNHAGQQPWIDTRPKLLTWVVVVGDGKYSIDEHLLDKQHSPEIYTALEHAAAAKGLQLVYPPLSLYQAADSAIHKTSESTVENLAKVSQPLHSEAILYVVMNANDPPYLWENWQIFYHDHVGFGQDRKRRTLNNLGHYSMSGASRFLFEQGEEKKITPTNVYVNISNVLTAKDYQSVHDYLEHIPGVLHTSVNSVTVDAVLYTLEIKISPQLLKSRLARKYTPLPETPEEGIINYRFHT